MAKGRHRTPQPVRRTLGLRAGLALCAASGLAAAVMVPRFQQTDASFVDNVWSSASFTAATLSIEESADNAVWTNQSTTSSPLFLRSGRTQLSVAVPLDLQPGVETFVPVYLRTSAGTVSSTGAVDLAMSAAQQLRGQSSNAELWDTYIAYRARFFQTAPATCDATTLTTGTEVIAAQSHMNTAPTPTAATLQLTTGADPATPGTAAMVCFGFTLDSTIATAAPHTAQQSIYPYWTFTAVQQ